MFTDVEHVLYLRRTLHNYEVLRLFRPQITDASFKIDVLLGHILRVGLLVFDVCRQFAELTLGIFKAPSGDADRDACRGKLVAAAYLCTLYVTAHAFGECPNLLDSIGRAV